MPRQKLLWSLVLGSIIGFAKPVQAQQLLTQPSKGSNIVWATTAVPTDSVLTQLTRHLQQRGFVLDTVDRAQGILTTKVALPASSRAGEMKLRIVKIGSDWKLTGIYVVPAYGSGVAYPADFIGMEMMPAKSAFRIVEEAAREISESSLRYDRAKVKFGVLTKMEEALKVVW
jgi:hypothetical protein